MLLFPKRISPFLLPSIIGNTAGAMIAIEVGAQGPNYGIVSACATGTHAIGEALKYLQWGECDVMLAGGSEARPERRGLARLPQGRGGLSARAVGGGHSARLCGLQLDARDVHLCERRPAKGEPPFRRGPRGFRDGRGVGRAAA